MDIKDLIKKLDHIEQHGKLLESTLTLQAVRDAESAAVQKAQEIKQTGNAWEKFTGWDPRIAGNIAIAKLAQENGLTGLFNSDGQFVVSYGDHTWSSQPGQSPRIAPPSPDDWKPLQQLKLVPPNAQGPSGLVNFLSGGKAQQEFDAVKNPPEETETEQPAPEQGAKVEIDNPDDQKEIEELDDLVTQYLSAKKLQEVAPINEAEIFDPISIKLIESFGYRTESAYSTLTGFTLGSDGQWNWEYPLITAPDGVVIYRMSDLALDLGISVGAVVVGTVFAIPTAGASEVAAGVIIGTRLARIGMLLQKWWRAFKAPMTVFKDARAARAAIKDIVVNYIDGFKRSVARALRPKTLLLLGTGTAGINWLMHYLGPYLPDWVSEYFNKAMDWIGRNIPNWIGGPAQDFVKYLEKKLGFENE